MSYRPDPRWEDHEIEPDYGGPRWRGHLYKALISVGVLAAFGAAVLYAYSEGAPADDRAAKPGNVPLVKAETTPVKEKPADPGGVKVPHRDRDLYRKLDIGTRKADKADAAKAPERRQARVPPRPQTYEDILAPKPGAKSKPSPKPKVGARKPAAPETRRVEAAPKAREPRTDTARTDTARTDTTRPRGQIAAVPSLRNRNPGPGDTADPGRDRDRQVADVSPRAGTKTVPKARPVALAKDRDTVQTASAIGPYRVQLGAFRSATKAQYEWKSLSRANKDLLGPLRMVIERVNLGPKGVYYRLQAGPLKTAPAARGLCRTLGKRKVDCILVNG